MQLEDVLKDITRPSILMRAARISLTSYSRDRDLKRIFRVQYLPQPRQVLERLVHQETELEEARKTGNAAYDLKFHIQVMTALLQELHLLPKEPKMP